MATDDPTKKVYDPSETIRIGVFKEAINDLREIDVMPADLDVVKQEFKKAGYQIIENVPTERTSTLGAFGGGLLEGLTYNTTSEIFGELGGDEVQRETEKQMTMEARERPAARLAGEVVGSIIGAPGKVAGLTAKAASKLGPMAARSLGALVGATEGAVSGIAAKPMGEKDKVSLLDTLAPALGAVGGAALTKGGKPTKPLKETLADPAAQVEKAKEIIARRKSEGVYRDVNVVNNEIVDQQKKPLKVYRGSRVDDPFSTKEKRQNEFFYFSDNPTIAKTYSGEKGFITNATLEMSKPFIVDAQGSFYKNILVETKQGLKEMSADQIARSAKKAGYDGVIIKNVQDAGPKTKLYLNPEESLGTNFIVFDKKNVIKPKTTSLKAIEEATGLKNISLLGVGSQNKVWKGKDPASGKEFAIKWGSLKENMFEYANLVGKEIPIVKQIQEIKNAGILTPQESAVLPDFGVKSFEEPPIALLKSKVLQPLTGDEKEVVKQVIPEDVASNTIIDIDKIDPNFPRVKELAQSLMGLKRVTNNIGSLNTDNLMVDPDLNKIVIADIGDIKFKPTDRMNIFPDTSGGPKPPPVGPPEPPKGGDIPIPTTEDVALSHFESLRRQQPKTFGMKQKPTVSSTLKQLGILTGADPSQKLTNEELNVIKKIFPELGLDPVFQKGRLFDPFLDLPRPAATSYVGGGITADVYGAAVPRSSVVTPQQAQKAAQDLAEIKPEDFTNLIKLAEQKALAPKEGLMLDTEQYVVKIPHSSKGRGYADIREYQENEIGIRQRIEEARQTGIVSPESMEHFVPTRLIDFQNPIDKDYYTAYVMPKLEPLPPELYTEIMREFPTSFDPPMINAYKLEPYHIKQLSPQAQELFKALEEIKDKAGIYWVDLHGGNVLIDPKTNKVVVVDPGHFMHFPTGKPPSIKTKPLEMPGSGFIDSDLLSPQE